MTEQVQDWQPKALSDSLERIPYLVNQDDVKQMIKTQVATLDRLECTNKSLVNCSRLAQEKLAATSKLYKRTAKQLTESKKDLDVIYKKILFMKNKLRAEKLAASQEEGANQSTNDSLVAASDPSQELSETAETAETESSQQTHDITEKRFHII